MGLLFTIITTITNNNNHPCVSKQISVTVIAKGSHVMKVIVLPLKDKDIAEWEKGMQEAFQTLTPQKI